MVYCDIISYTENTDQLFNATDYSISNYFQHGVVNHSVVDGKSHAVSTWIDVNKKYIKEVSLMGYTLYSIWSFVVFTNYHEPR